LSTRGARLAQALGLRVLKVIDWLPIEVESTGYFAMASGFALPSATPVARDGTFPVCAFRLL